MRPSAAGTSRVQTKQAVADAVLEHEHKHPVCSAGREQIQHDCYPYPRLGLTARRASRPGHEGTFALCGCVPRGARSLMCVVVPSLNPRPRARCGSASRAGSVCPEQAVQATAGSCTSSTRTPTSPAVSFDCARCPRRVANRSGRPSNRHADVPSGCSRYLSGLDDVLGDLAQLAVVVLTCSA